MHPRELPRPRPTQLTRIYAEPLLACVADNRKLMRDAAIAALEKVTTSGGGEILTVWCVCHNRKIPLSELRIAI